MLPLSNDQTPLSTYPAAPSPDLFRHFTIVPSDFTNAAPSGAVQIKAPQGKRIERVSIYVAAGTQLFVGADRVANAVAGGYDVFHPGGGSMVEVINDANFLYIVAPVVPVTNVEVFIYGGRFALIPV